MNIILAIILGFLFGFVLKKIGAADPQNIINMLQLKDLHLMKVILFGIGFSSLVLFALISLDSIDLSHISVKSSYVGVIVGGGILGLGWAISGFCPGTGIVAAGAGRKDALFFLAGGLLGAFIYMVLYGFVKDSILFKKLGGTSTLAATESAKFPALFPEIPGIIAAGAIAIVFMLVAWILPGNKQTH